VVLARALAVAAVIGSAVAARPARADDFVVVRGVYYREASTRVIQPMVDVQRDSPSGVDVGAHFLIDAITSASIAAGTALDNVFTETRNEVGFNIRKRWSRSEVTAAYKYSAESDYWSHAVGISGGWRLWGDTATLRVALGTSFDSMATQGRTPACGVVRMTTSCFLDTYFGGVSWTQVLSPVATAQLSYETAYLDGFQGNLYRAVPNFGYEVLPYAANGTVADGRRLRSAIAPRAGYYFPSTGTGVQLSYRYYFDLFPGTYKTPYDPWDLHSHTIEGRVYQYLSRDVELRLLYRQYLQNKAAFWCDAVAQPSCYPAGSAYYSTDPKLGPVHTEYPEAKVYWHLESLRPYRFLSWFASGTLEVSYGIYFQNTSFGATSSQMPFFCPRTCVVQAGYTMPY
jgi:hypothetical protein